MTELAVSGSLSEDEKQVAVRAALDLQIKNTQTDKAQADFVTTVKNSALFSFNWDELLCAAPMALSLLGSCMVAASCDAASRTTLKKPQGGFKYLVSDSLRANLVHVTDVGADSFRIAQKNMDSIGLKAQKMYTTIDDICTDLSGTPAEAKDALDIHMDILYRGARDCQREAEEIDAAFNNWLQFVSELHRVAEDTQGDVASKKHANEINMKVNEAKAKLTEQQESTAKKSLDTFADVMKTTQEAFKKASDAVPSGWDLIGMQFVSGLCNTVLTAANNQVQAKTGNGAAPSKSKKSKGEKGTSRSDTDRSTLPENYNDPAYSQILTYVETFNNIRSVCVGGPGGSIDWEGASGSGKNANSSITFIKEMLEHARTSFKTSGQAPSQTYTTLLNNAIDLIGQLVDAVKSKDEIGWTAPDPKSPEVKKWQAEATEIYNKANVLATTARSMPGVGGAQVPTVGGSNVAPPSNPSGGLTEQILSSATARVESAQAAYKSAQENYRQANESLINVQKNLAEIKGALEQMRADQVTLEQIKAILIKCIETIVSLKAQIAKLVNFFDAVATLVTHTTEYQVKPFIAYLDKLIAGAMAKPSNLGGFTFSDFQRQMVFMSCIQVRAYYSLFRSIALLYVPISQKWILPGVDMVNELSLVIADDAALTKKRQALNKFTTDGIKDITDRVKESQNKIMNSLNTRIKDAAAETKLLPPALPSTQKAIEEGKAVVTEAVKAGIEEYKPMSARPLGKTKFEED